MDVERRVLRVQGVVQGVGFRPFVYRLASALHLAGNVRNLGDAGVEIQVEGPRDVLDQFRDRLLEEMPPLALITGIDEDASAPTGVSAFAILPSSSEHGGRGALPPDVSICDDCIADVLGPSRYSNYWATSCTNCGPRFTVIRGLPYDRPQTSMDDFPMCASCRMEYTDPSDRRYHAQTIACDTCGPSLAFDGSDTTPIADAVRALAAGKIVAIKGIGGTHIACDAENGAVVRTLRERLGRPGQPFALMATLDVVEQIAFVEDEERSLLRSPQRPIVVLCAKPETLPYSVAPGLRTVGVMLPYTGLHVLLMRAINRPLVMTSANLPGQPMLIENEEIKSRLTGVVDHLLLHDRRIVARCDDSVRRRSGGRTTFIRRSRGFVPQGITADCGKERILALGPETGLTFALYANRTVTMSQHIGSVDDIETYEYLTAAIEHLQGLTGVQTLDTVACDLHPRFLTTRLADEMAAREGLRLAKVQHHEAHLVALLVEHGIDEGVGIILDGYGYGHDGTAWGGEILAAKDGRIDRVGSLAPARLPGGDLAAREPLRMAAAILHAGGVPWQEIEAGLRDRGVLAEKLSVLLPQLESGVNAPWTTSAGRFLDAVAAWTGVCTKRTYEGEPAMRLEAAAAGGEVFDIPVAVEKRGGRIAIDTVGVFREIVDRVRSVRVEDIAATAQWALATGSARAAVEVAQEAGLKTVGFTGGVAYNDAIARAIRACVEDAGLEYITNEAVPCGDGGVALGQAGYAGRRWSSSDAKRARA